MASFGLIAQVISGIIVLGVLVVIHELGHFLLAKWNGVGVLEFAVGFGKKLYSKKVGETTYSLRAIPLGGYVRMVGDDPRSLHGDPDAKVEGVASSPDLALQQVSELDEDTKRLMQDKSRWFLTQSYPAKLAIVIAGPAFNFISAILLSIIVVYFFGLIQTVDEAVIGSVREGLPAFEAGLKPGDRVKAINGKPITLWKDLAENIYNSGGKELTLSIERKADPSDAKSAVSPLELKVTPKESEELALINGVKTYAVGIQPGVQMERVSVGFPEAVERGTMWVVDVSWLTLKGLWGTVSGVISTKNLRGPIFIIQQAGESAERGPEQLISFIIFLSVTLAVLNLLPIPVLDGGHIVFFTIEAIKGSPVSIRMQERATQVGMLLLLCLMLFAVSNDLFHVFSAATKG